MINNKYSQRKRLVSFLKKHGSVSRMEAFKELGIVELSSRIGEINAEGEYLITSDWEHSVNQFGEPIRYKRYKLEVAR